MSNLLKNKKIISLIFLGLFSIIFFISNIEYKKISPPQQTNKIINENTKSEVKSEKQNITLEVEGKRHEDRIENEASVYDLMVMLQNKGKINFTEKNYTGIGKFIVSLNGIKNGEKNWIYYVNGIKAQVGVSNYKIYPGDVVSWKYEKYE